MAPKTLPPRDLVRQLLSYDEATGMLTWRSRPKRPQWNTRYAGTSAGWIDSKGYWNITINKNRFAGHRLIWLMYYDNPIPDFIDHIDCDKLNNRIANLRAATPNENQANVGIRRTNRTGIKGVSCYFRATITVDGRRYMQSFRTLEEAIKARREAAAHLHGKFARHE
jgi:hypothetical protein